MVVFVPDFFQKAAEHPVKFRMFAALDERTGLKGRKQGIRAGDIADQTVIKQDDQTLSTEVGGGVKSDGVKSPGV